MIESSNTEREQKNNHIAFFFILSLAILFLAGYIYSHWNFLLSLCDQPGDYALILLETAKAKNFNALTGPYSRFHFRHPGPLAFYYYALFESISIPGLSAQASASLAQLLFNVFMIAVAGLCIWVHTKRHLLPGLFFITYVLFAQYAMRGVWHEIWGPATVLAPMICFLCLSASLASGNVKFFFFWALSGAFSVSNHVGAAVIAGPIGVLAIVQFFLSRKEAKLNLSRLELVSVAAGLVLCIATLTPVLYEATSGKQFGNIGRLFAFFLESEHQRQTFLTTLQFVSSYYLAHLTSFHFLWIPFTLACVVLPFVVPLKNRLYLWHLRLFAGLSFLLLFVGALQVTGPLTHSLMMFGYSVSALTFFVAMAVVGGFLLERIPIFSFLEKPLIIFISLMLVILASVYLGYVSKVIVMSCNHKYDDAVTWMAPSAEYMHRVDIERPGQWRALAAIVERIYRKGVGVCVLPEWRFMFGEDLVCGRQVIDHPMRYFKILSTEPSRSDLKLFRGDHFVLQERIPIDPATGEMIAIRD